MSKGVKYCQVTDMPCIGGQNEGHDETDEKRGKCLKYSIAVITLYKMCSSRKTETDKIRFKVNSINTSKDYASICKSRARFCSKISESSGTM